MARWPNDNVLAGLFVLCISILAVTLATSYSAGSASQMGPGYFPLMIGAALAAIGIALLWRGLRAESAVPVIPPLRPSLLVLASLVSFGLLIERVGLAPTALISVLLAAYAVPHASTLEVVALATGLTAFALLVFIGALGLPMEPFVWPF